MAHPQEFTNLFLSFALYLINCWELISPTSILQGCECKNTGLQPNLIYCLGSRCLLRKARIESHKYLAKNIHQQNFISPKIIFLLLKMRKSETVTLMLTFKNSAKKFCGVSTKLWYKTYGMDWRNSKSVKYFFNSLRIAFTVSY